MQPQIKKLAFEMTIFYVFSIDYQLISHRKAIVQEAVNKGFKVTVVAADTGYRQEIENMGVRFIELPINRVGTNLIEELNTFKFLYKLYKKEKPDLVHHVSAKVVLWGGLAAKLTKVPRVVNAINGLGVFFQNGKIDSLTKRIFVRILNFSHRRDKVVTILQNKDDVEFFVSNNAIPREKIQMIDGSGIDLNDFQYTEEVVHSPLKLLFTSRMIREKGVMDVIEAAQLLKNTHKDKLCFQLCGLIESGPTAISKEDIEARCDGEYIQYLGQRTDVKELLQESAIVLLPSYYREGIPKSLIEAAAIGRPIVTTDSVGCRETVKDGVNGYLIPVKSPKALAEKISLLAADPELRKKMGRESRALAEKRFSLANVISRHFSIYESLLANPSSSK